MTSTSRTREKSLRGPEIKLEVGKKSRLYQAYRYYNLLTNYLKTMEAKTAIVRTHMKNWVQANIK